MSSKQKPSKKRAQSSSSESSSDSDGNPRDVTLPAKELKRETTLKSKKKDSSPRADDEVSRADSTSPNKKKGKINE